MCKVDICYNRYIGCCSFEGKEFDGGLVEPQVGCFKEGVSIEEIWVGMIGLSMHL